MKKLLLGLLALTMLQSCSSDDSATPVAECGMSMRIIQKRTVNGNVSIISDETVYWANADEAPKSFDWDNYGISPTVRINDFECGQDDYDLVTGTGTSTSDGIVYPSLEITRTTN